MQSLLLLPFSPRQRKLIHSWQSARACIHAYIHMRGQLFFSQMEKGWVTKMSSNTCTKFIRNDEMNESVSLYAQE